ncbi:MAG: epoxyqueuosine reductase QueH, partial [Deltaproteobacteria bacterium]|nr:epoxyqueuosine reductase QueH [Deltaproteobacteria bacterium]
MCCGPCSIYPFKMLVDSEIDVSGFFYNPNIQPLEEYLKRREAVGLLALNMGLDVIFSPYYSPDFFTKDNMGRPLKEFPKDLRCEYCYTLRLEATAEIAKGQGFDMFSTTLLYSKRQNHVLIKELGERIAGTHDIGFYYVDFRNGWQEGIAQSRSMGIFRQNYCGCSYSFAERFL